jgi:hypothetical protein
MREQRLAREGPTRKGRNQTAGETVRDLGRVYGGAHSYEETEREGGGETITIVEGVDFFLLCVRACVRACVRVSVGVK